MRLARAAWDRLRATRQRLNAAANDTRRSMTAVSASLRPRKSLASPTFHPARSSLFLLSLRISHSLLPPRDLSTSHCVVAPESIFTRFDDDLRCRARPLVKHLEDHDRVRIDPTNDSPRMALIVDPELATPRTNPRHGSRVRHPQVLSALQHPQQEAGFAPSSIRERRTPYLPVKPHQRFVGRGHGSSYVRTGICQV